MNLKLGNFTSLFVVFFITFFTIFYLKGGVERESYVVNHEYTTATKSSVLSSMENAAKDAKYLEYNTTNQLFNTAAKRQNAFNSMLETYQSNFGFSSDAYHTINRYLPVVCFVDYDGYYFNYTDLFKEGTNRIVSKYDNTSSELQRIETDINFWTFYSDTAKNAFKLNTSPYSIRFYIGDNVTVTDMDSEDKSYTGNRIKVYKTICGERGEILYNNKGEAAYAPLAFLVDDEKFYEIRDNTIINDIEKGFSYYINNFNQTINTDAISYNISFAYTRGQDNTRSIENPTILAFLQGDEAYNALGKYTIYAMSASEISKSKSYYIAEDYVVPKGSDPYFIPYYHKIGASCYENLSQDQKDSIKKHYSSKEDAAMAGAYPCPRCIR